LVIEMNATLIDKREEENKNFDDIISSVKVIRNILIHPASVESVTIRDSFILLRQ